MKLDISKFLNRFIDEARDLLRQLSGGIKYLEQGQSDPELINGVFRAVHTLKGSSRMLNLLPITETAHSLEELLSALRERKLEFSPELVDVLYQATDSLTAQVEHLANTRTVDSLPEKPAALCAKLLALAGKAPEQSEPEPAASQEETGTAGKVADVMLQSSDTVRLRLDNLSRLSKLISEVTASHAGLRELVRDAKQIRANWNTLAQSGKSRQAFEALFDRLKEIEGAQQSLVYSLHDQALSLRMLPLRQVFEPVARHVREIGRILHKRVTSHISGEDIELDRHIIEQLSEPLVHLLRNAIDHGIEDAAVRRERGKPPTGQIRLSARQDGGWVVIELSDDGAGLSLQKIRHKLQQQGMSAEDIEALSEHDLSHQIFTPGFSTSGMITELSGRGVGLDVVKRKVVSDLHGMIDIRSQEGQGTTLSLRLPLSLAMLRVLLVESEGQVLGFNAQYVVELTRVATDKVLVVAERNVFVLRNEFVPIFKFDRLVELPPQEGRQEPSGKDLLVLVLQAQHEKMALVINGLIDERDLIINPLPQHLAGNPLVAGVVNHGYRNLVSLIHVPHLLSLARSQYQRTADAALKPAVRQHLLVVDDSLNTREIEKDVLEAWGYQVTLAEDGLDGLNKARNGDFHAIITDVEMPFMDGFTLTSHLREHERYKNRPIIIITSREKDSDRRRGIEVGADAYIVKGSFDQNSLVDTLRALLG